MQAEVDLAAAASLIGERSRARMLLALLDGRPRAAGDLARSAGVSPATASQHLARLLDGGLISVEADGRHRFYSLADERVAAALETLAAISPHSRVSSLRQAHRGELLRDARSCYDHLAGRLGVVVSDALVEQGAIAPLVAGDVGTLVDAEHPLLDRLGLRLGAEPARVRRPMVRGCLDWTEQRPHLAGHLGACVLQALLSQRWVARRRADRALTITPAGVGRLADALDVDPGSLPEPRGL